MMVKLKKARGHRAFAPFAVLRLLIIQIGGDWMSPSLSFSKKIGYAGRQPTLLSRPLPAGSLDLFPSDMSRFSAYDELVLDFLW